MRNLLKLQSCQSLETKYSKVGTKQVGQVRHIILGLCEPSSLIICHIALIKKLGSGCSKVVEHTPGNLVVVGSDPLGFFPLLLSISSYFPSLVECP